jgi:uncharacterized protein YcnI
VILNLAPRRFAALVVAAAAVLAMPAAAGAHIQVRPTEAAPLDPVLWTVLVPNEGDEETRGIELQVPEGVIPFSFNDQRGWKRTLKLNPDQSIERIVWEGRLASDGLAELSFLATTPEREGKIAWKALQIYQGNRVVRWIGDEGTDEPASFTTISADTPRQNAGGEGAETAEQPSAAADDETAPPAAATTATTGDDGTDTAPIVLAAAALAIALLALLLALRRPRDGRH